MLLYADYLFKFPPEQQQKAFLILFLFWFIPYVFVCISEIIKIYKSEN